MPPRPLPYREVKRKLESVGFEEVSQRGSHVKFARQTPLGLQVVIVPRHREVVPGMLRSILRQAGLTWDELETLWRSKPLTERAVRCRPASAAGHPS